MIKVEKTATGCSITHTGAMTGMEDVWHLSFDSIRQLVLDLIRAYGFPERKEK